MSITFTGTMKRIVLLEDTRIGVKKDGLMKHYKRVVVRFDETSADDVEQGVDRVIDQQNSPEFVDCIDPILWTWIKNIL
jgi:hypothetical protein